MDFHPLANIFPLMSERELEDLAADIAAHGQHAPIHTWQGKILDGRNRFKACLKAQVEPWFKTWEGAGDPVAFVVSMNLRRRHLDASQRAMVAGRLTELEQGRPAQGRPALGRPPHLGGSSIENTPENRAHEEASICTFSPQGGHVTVPQAAELLNVGRHSVLNAREVLEHGDLDLVAAVEAGQVSVSDAAKIAVKPLPIQRTALDAVKAGRAKTLTEAAKSLVGEARMFVGATGGESEALPSDVQGAVADGRGRLVPEPYLSIFATREAFFDLGRQVDELRCAVKEVVESPAGYYLRKELEHLGEKFKQIKYAVTRTAPYTVASGKRHEPKWVSEIAWRSLSDDERGEASRPAARVPRR